MIRATAGLGVEVRGPAVCFDDRPAWNETRALPGNGVWAIVIVRLARKSRGYQLPNGQIADALLIWKHEALPHAQTISVRQVVDRDKRIDGGIEPPGDDCQGIA